MAAYYNGGGTRLTGHLYSNKLNTPLVRKKLPINPGDVPVRVLVTSPLATDSSAVARAKLASIKSDYIIEPDKISATLQFFKNVGNKVMEGIEYDEEELNTLPEGDVSLEMFHLNDSDNTLHKIQKEENENDGQSTDEDDEQSSNEDDGQSDIVDNVTVVHLF